MTKRLSDNQGCQLSFCPLQNALPIIDSTARPAAITIQSRSLVDADFQPHTHSSLKNPVTPVRHEPDRKASESTVAPNPLTARKIIDNS